MIDLINLGGAYPQDNILGEASPVLTAQDLNQPMTQAQNDQQPMLPRPTISERMMQIGQTLLIADQEGTAAAAKFLSDQKQQGLRNAQINRAEQRQRRRDARQERLDEYELLGRIRERQLAELQSQKRLQLTERLKAENPDLASLIDLDPSKAAEVLASRQQGGGGPFKGSSLDAQDTNILLTGDPESDVYKAAYNRQAQAKMVTGADGQVYTIQPDMSAFAVPGQPRALTAPQATTGQALSQPTVPSASSVAPSEGSLIASQPQRVSGAGNVPVRRTNVGGLTITQANLKGDDDSKQKFERQLRRVLEDARALDEGGGIPQPIESPADFIMNPVRNVANTEDLFGFLPGGQDVARAFNTENQRRRDQIQQEIPKMFLELRKGGGLTGKELDTAAEREFYLQSLFRKGTPLETILAGLESVSEDYGTGDLANELRSLASPSGDGEDFLIDQETLNNMTPEERALFE